MAAGSSALPDDFDPGAAARGDGVYGLPTGVDESRVVIVPVPFEATVSYGAGTARAPTEIRRASRQVELFDAETGRPYEDGIAMLDFPAEVAAWSAAARRLVEPVIDAGGPGDDPELLRRVDEADSLCDRMNAWVRGQATRLLGDGRIPIVLGGDHSVPFGGMQAVAERHPGVGVLHFDAHYDLRPAYDGLRWSHASIMHNVLEEIPGVSRIVHVGIRDFSEEEQRYSRAAGGRSVTYGEATLRDRLEGGETWRSIVAEIVERLPYTVYVSFDVDGLDPTLCPGTGTPVPGGLTFREATSLLVATARSGRRIVAGDLVEVTPVDGDREWNANVGARLLYKIIGCAILSHRCADDMDGGE